ncbi:MAG TPA: hypothetical protein VFS28_03590, partial [Gemmatimonadales bacterium]|nr:hypothetical protein [Gemmatimonadales bacterium]
MALTRWLPAAAAAAITIGAVACDQATQPTSTGRVVQAVTGAAHACALTNAGRVFCWGSNDSGQVGAGSRSDHPWPVEVLLGPLGVHRISAGPGATCATLPGHEALCWGGGDPTPRSLEGSSGVDWLVLGNRICGLASPSVRRCWASLTAAPSDMALATPLQFLTGGGNQLCGLAVADSTAWCFNIVTDSELPVGGGHKFTRLSTTATHTCGLDDGDLIWCWGYNALGQLGTGTTYYYTDTPMGLSGQTGSDGFVDVVTGGQHSCALFADGSVGCWGNEAYGELGDGTQTPRNQAEPFLTGLATSTAFTAIATGGPTTCGIDHGGALYCW